jgi:hydroxymethylpyrimidine pyrophosphatase-like HAD family hydrolase
MFDLDDTIYLPRGPNDKDKVEKYHIAIKNFLETLYNQGKKLCLVTHNIYPDNILKKLHIEHLFEIISKPSIIRHSDLQTIQIPKTVTRLVTYSGGIVSLIENKDTMISRILKQFNIKKEKVIFFDDFLLNIEHVRNLGIESIHVGVNGIDLDNIIIT